MSPLWSLDIKNFSMSPSWRIISQVYSTSAHNCSTSPTPLIMLRLTSNFLFRNILGLLLWVCTNGSGPIYFKLLYTRLGLGLTRYCISPNFQFRCKRLPPAYIVTCGPYCMYYSSKKKIYYGFIVNHETQNLAFST